MKIPPQNSFGLLELTNSIPTSVLSIIIMPNGISAATRLFIVLSGYHGFAITHLRSSTGFSLLRLYANIFWVLKYSLTKSISAITFTLTPSFDFSNILLITISGHNLVEIRISLLQQSIRSSNVCITLSNDKKIMSILLMLSEILYGKEEDLRALSIIS